MSRIPTGPALTKVGALGVLGAGLGAFACGDVQRDGVVPPTVDASTVPPTHDAGVDARGVAEAEADSGYRFGAHDAMGHTAADALADAASDGHIFEPPCGVPPPR